MGKLARATSHRSTQVSYESTLISSI